MNRPILLIAVSAFLAAPAFGQEAPAPSGRYQIAPDKDGFVRLDTRTGAMTHCDKREGAWHCDVLAEERSDFDRRLDALAGEVDSLTAEVARLTDRLAAAEGRLQNAPVVPPSATGPSAAPRDKELDEALSFAERLMRRFFDLVRELKNDPPTQGI